jgi:tetratricopeptide (TPR) repeat protein
MLATGGGKRIELGRAAAVAFSPSRLDPALALEAIEGRIERSLLNLQHVSGYLLNAFGDGPSMLGLKRDGLEDQQVEGALQEIVWFTHANILRAFIVDRQGMMTINNKYLDVRQFIVVDSLGMRMLRRSSGFLCVALCIGMRLFAQENALRDVDERLNQLSALEQKGQYAEVVQRVSPLIESNGLNERELGTAELILGIAYHEQGERKQAQSAYEKALRMLDGHREYAADHAAALDNFARLYLDSGYPDIAARMESDVLRTYEGLGDHADVARSCVTLASLEINDGHRRKGKEYLQRALREAKPASGLDPDFFAQVSSTQGWLALLGGDTAAAISDYTHAVELWKAAHGENHMLTGWGYMLLGKAHAQAGQNAVALEVMQQGLHILEQSVGSNNAKYLAAEIAYSQVLDQSGEHTEAARLKGATEQAFEKLNRDACIRCSISAVAPH